MPALKRFGAIVVRMYADDHAPPHVHVEAPDFEVLLRLSDFTVLAGSTRASRIAEVLEWLRDEQNNLKSKWAELNERG